MKPRRMTGNQVYARLKRKERGWPSLETGLRRTGSTEWEWLLRKTEENWEARLHYQEKGANIRNFGSPNCRTPVPEYIDPVFRETSPKRSFLVMENERFGLVFAKTRSKISGTGDWNFVSWVELIADPHHRDADLDPAFHFDVDPDADPDPTCQFVAGPDATTHVFPYLDPPMLLKDPLRRRLPLFHFNADPQHFYVVQ
jgi:hypothetical protein